MVNKKRVIYVLVLLISWEIIVQLNIYSKALMPSVVTIALSFGHNFFAIISAIAVSLLMITKGLFIAVVITFIVTWISMLSDTLDDLVDFTVQFMHPIPGIALLPLVILWLGIGENAIYFIIVHATVWPLILNVKSDVKRVNKAYDRLIGVFKLSVFKQVYKVYFLGAMNGIITGLKIGWSRGWRAFISAEMIFGIMSKHSGIGWFIFEKRIYMDTAGLISGILAIIVSSLVIEVVLFNKLEEKTISRW